MLVLMAGCDSPSAPPPPATGPTVEARDDFERANTAWALEAGTWTRKDGALLQSETGRTSNVALLKEKRFTDVDASVRFRPVSGKVDASGGLVLRAKDTENYVLVRANALEGNFRLYTVVKGSRRQIASTDIEAPKLGEWRVLRAAITGDRIQAWLDGRALIDHRDGTFTEGWCGLWTKADSVTEFDDFVARGAEARP